MKPNSPPQGWIVKLVPLRASPAAQGELWVLVQPCPTPPMVPRGVGWGEAGTAGAARTQPGVRVVPSTPAASQAPIPALNPEPHSTTRSRAPHGSHYQLHLPVALQQDRGEVLHWGQGVHVPPNSPNPSQASGPPSWQGPAHGLGVLNPPQPVGPPQSRGQSCVSQSTQGGRALSPSDTAPNTPPGLSHTGMGLFTRCW